MKQYRTLMFSSSDELNQLAKEGWEVKLALTGSTVLLERDDGRASLSVQAIKANQKSWSDLRELLAYRIAEGLAKVESYAEPYFLGRVEQANEVLQFLDGKISLKDIHAPDHA